MTLMPDPSPKFSHCPIPLLGGCQSDLEAPGGLRPPLAWSAQKSRRTFLADVGMGFTGLALGAMLARDGVVRGNETRLWLPPDGRPQQPAKAKSVIWIFLVGGMSHTESFDPKPALNEHAGKTIAESPFKAVLDSPYLKKNLR